MESKQRVAGIMALDLIFCFCFFVTAAVSNAACFLVERDTGKCVDGSAHNLFSVSQGQSFHLVTSTALFCGHGFWALKTLRGNPSALQFGILLGTFYSVAFIALSNSAIWGSFSASVSALDCSENGIHLPQVGNGTALKCNGYASAFSALSVLSSLIFICNAAVSVVLYVWQKDFLPHGGMILQQHGGEEDLDDDDLSLPHRTQRGVVDHHNVSGSNDIYESMVAPPSPDAERGARGGHHNYLSSPPSQSQFEPIPARHIPQQQQHSDVEESFLSTDNNQ